LAVPLALLLSPGTVPACAEDLAGYFVQAACVDATGAPRPGVLPFEPGCGRSRPLRGGEPLPYRKHDWPAAAQAAALPLGYQASDSLAGRLLGRPAIIQTFDFADATRAFARRDPGDGGQVVMFGPAGAAAVMTEDGSGGRQWFQGPDCARATPDPGWFFAAAPLRAEWQSRMVRLNITRAAEACPRSLNPSLTRWRIGRIPLPWREAATGATAAAPADVLVSEHYGGNAIAAAHHLERFWFARGLGLVRWERWENPALSALPRREAMAALIASSRRCPEIAFGEAPAAAWQMVDCRSWTNMVRARPGAPLAALDWP
jgi:hypothetical protein